MVHTNAVKLATLIFNSSLTTGSMLTAAAAKDSTSGVCALCHNDSGLSLQLFKHGDVCVTHAFLPAELRG